MKKLLNFNDKPYEVQVMYLIAFVAITRVLIGLVMDVMKEPMRWDEVITDVAVLFVFVSLLIAATDKTRSRTSHPLFGVVLVTLLALNFLQFGGVQGNSRFNYYGGFIIIILLYKDRVMYWLLVYQSCLIIFLTFLTIWSADANPFFVAIDESYVDFLFMIVSMGILTYHLKLMTAREINRLEELSTYLNHRVSRAKELNHQLVWQGQELAKAQALLEAEVQKKTVTILERQRAIEKYIYMNTVVIQEPIQKLNEEMSKLNDETLLNSMMMASQVELNEKYKNITEALLANEKLSRTRV
jgi:hypothetical protein